MALTLQQLRDDIRLTEFIYRGQPIDLIGSLGERVMSTTRLNMLIHEAGREVQADLKDKREIAHNHCIKNSDALPLPSDMLILSQVVIYDDDNETITSGSVTGASSQTVLIDGDATFSTDGIVAGYRVDNTTDGSSGLVSTVDSETQLTLADTLIGGSDNTFVADDTYEIYDPDAATAYDITQSTVLVPAMTLEGLREGREVESGKPAKYMIAEQNGTQFLLFDVVASVRYFIDVLYYPTLEDMAGDGTALKLRQIYQSLYYLKTCAKVAIRLGDDRGVARFTQLYEVEKEKLATVTRSRRFVQTRFQVMP